MIQQERVKAAAVNQQALSARIPTPLQTLSPLHAHDVHPMKSGGFDRFARAQDLQQREDAGGQRLAQMRAREHSLLDQTHAMAECGHSRGQRAPGWSGADNADVTDKHCFVACEGRLVDSSAATRGCSRTPDGPGE